MSPPKGAQGEEEEAKEEEEVKENGVKPGHVLVRAVRFNDQGNDFKASVNSNGDYAAHPELKEVRQCPLTRRRATNQSLAGDVTHRFIPRHYVCLTKHLSYCRHARRSRQRLRVAP